jgi:hypothetical protein
LDLKQTFKSYIESHKQTARTLSISGMVPALEEAFAAIPTEGRQILAPFAGRQLSLFVRASFEPDTWISWVRYARLVLSPDLKPTIAEEAVEQLGLENEMMFYRLGEKDYADQQMNRGALNRHFRSANTLPFLTTRKRIKEVTRDAAISAAVDFIEAVSAIAEKVPAPSDIGGPVDVIFLGRNVQPERVRWKSLAK